MKKAANVILQGAQPSSGRTSRTGNQRAPSPKTETPISKPRTTVDSQKAFPSPKSGHAPTSRPSSRRSPFPDHISRERNEQNQQWLSLSHADQSADNEQQSMLASVMLEPEHQRRLREIVDVQLGVSHRPSSRPLVSPARALPVPPPSSALSPQAILPQPAHFEDVNGGESDDGAGSDRTSAMWHSSAHNAQHSANPPVMLLDEAVLQSLSLEEMLSVQRHLQQAIERRATAAGHGVLSPTAVAGSAATPMLVVDAAAVEQRRHLRRSGSRSGTNGESSAFGLPNSQALHTAPQIRATSTSSYATQHDEEGEDPELQSVHSDADQQRLGSLGGMGGIEASAVTYTTQNPARPPSSLGQLVSAPSGGRVSRTNGALLPHHKMLYGPRVQQALPCLSPFTDNAQAVNHHVAHLHLSNNNNTPSPSLMESFSRSSSRPPSRSSTSHHPLSASLQQSGNLQGMAWSLSPPTDSYLEEHYNAQQSLSSTAGGGANSVATSGRAAVLLEVVHAQEGVSTSSALTAALQQQQQQQQQQQPAVATSSAETTLPLAQFLQQQRRQHVDNPLVLSPSSAFDDLSTTGGSFTSYQSQRSLASSSGPQTQSRVSVARRKNSTSTTGSGGSGAQLPTYSTGNGAGSQYHHSQMPSSGAVSSKSSRSRSSGHKTQGALPIGPPTVNMGANAASMPVGIASTSATACSGTSNKT